MATSVTVAGGGAVTGMRGGPTMYVSPRPWEIPDSNPMVREEGQPWIDNGIGIAWSGVSVHDRAGWQLSWMSASQIPLGTVLSKSFSATTQVGIAAQQRDACWRLTWKEGASS